MKRTVFSYFYPFLLAILTALSLSPTYRTSASKTFQASGAEITLLDRDLSPVNEITDGDRVSLRIQLGENVKTPLLVQFELKDTDFGVAICTIPAGKRDCQTEPFLSLGWRWSSEANPGSQLVLASGPGIPQGLEMSVQVKPRPVVLVHGFSSSWEAWTNYLGPQGYLAGIDVQGFAVGDGQEPGVMNTGSLTAPAGRTNTIAENAAILGDYIARVKQATGAQMVDLISHSMGGLISRYYIDRVMQDRDVAQLIMLGSPMAGTDCADLPAALGLYLPATLEIRPSYVNEIFNNQVTHRHGVPFHALAGVAIQNAFQSPCTGVPTDLAVSFQSVTAIPLTVARMPVLHVDLNTSEQVFSRFIKPLLESPPGGFPDSPDPEGTAQAGAPLQFTRVFTGHVDAGSSQEVAVQIEPGVSVASFSLYDTTRSLDVSVKGASGKTIELSTEKNGLVVIQDPSSLFYLGYGFQDPKPGAWKVSLLATERTPPGGADYALTAYFQGGATLQTRSSTLLPKVNENVQVEANLDLGGQSIDLDQGEAEIRTPEGNTEIVTLQTGNGEARLNWKPPSPGLYGVDLRVEGTTPEGERIERTAFLAFEAQPGSQLTIRTLALGAALFLAAGLLLGVLLFLWWQRNKARSH